MMSLRTPVIEVKGLAHRYLSGTQLQVQALNRVDFVVHENESVGIVGPAGSGKSTLLSHLNGLMRPQEGDVRAFGQSLGDSRTDMKQVRRRIGMLFQNPEQQLFERFAGDDVAFGPKNYGVEGEELRRRVKTAMEMAGLPFALKDRLTMELSLGEKRRLALAGVFSLDPDVMVLDEPTASLDPGGRRQILGVLKQWKNVPGRSLVVVSHNMEDILELSDRVYLLAAGSVVHAGETKELFTHRELLLRHGLSLTVPLQVVHRLHEKGISLSGNPSTAAGVAAAIAAAIAASTGRMRHGTA
jgi:energy-coupling factor transport system ATP-binding protein